MPTQLDCCLRVEFLWIGTSQKPLIGGIVHFALRSARALKPQSQAPKPATSMCGFIKDNLIYKGRGRELEQRATS